ncbi:MAG: SpoIIE family protein phosphatase [Nitrospinae bacterium]|nr:SpoIIE family protein phosphatase [Nitrospinota bacterium]
MSESSQVKNIEEARQKLVEYEERIQNLETCIKIASLLASELDLDTLLDVIMKTAKKAMGADACSLALIDEAADELVFQVALSDVGAQIKSLARVKLGEGIVGSVARTGKPILARDAYERPKFNPEYDRRTGFKTGSILCAPLKRDNKIVGVCQVIHSRTKGKTFSKDDLPLFRMVCDSSALAIRNALAVKTALKNQELEKDIRFARAVQEGFLPKSPPLRDDLLCAAKTVPGDIVGGDFYDFVPLDSRRMAVVIADVSGKGVAAALSMARMTGDFRIVSRTDDDPGAALHKINNLMCDWSEGKCYATALYATIDLKKRKMAVANAGHPNLVLLRRGKRFAGDFKAGGVPLGIMPNAQYREDQLDLEPGDRLFLYTDGVVQARNKQHIPFGLKKLCDILEGDPRNPETSARTVEQAIQKHLGGAKQNDDWTFLALQIP